MGLYTLGFIENKEELKAFCCKSLNDDELSELCLVCADETAKAEAKNSPKIRGLIRTFIVYLI